MKNRRERSDCAGITALLRIILHLCHLPVFDSKIYICTWRGEWPSLSIGNKRKFAVAIWNKNGQELRAIFFFLKNVHALIIIKRLIHGRVGPEGVNRPAQWIMARHFRADYHLPAILCRVLMSLIHLVDLIVAF
jgi:hypothetical protein